MRCLWRAAGVFSVWLSIVLAPAALRAQTAAPAGDAAAREAFEQGRGAYERGDFRAALAAFERAHALSGRPELLFNVGRAADSEGQAGRARQAYAAYLVALPSAANADFVRGRLARLQGDAGTSGAANLATSDAPTLLADAHRELAAENFEEARALFMAAHVRLPTAGTHRGIALAECALRDYPACIAHAEAALASPVVPLDDAQRAALQALDAQARGSVGWLALETEPLATALRVDGTPLARTPGRPLALAVGEHVLEADAPGFATETRQLQLGAAKVQSLKIVFAQPLAEAEPRVHPSRRRWYRSPWLWTAVGVVTAGAAAGAVTAMSRGGDKVLPASGGSTGMVGTSP